MRRAGSQRCALTAWVLWLVACGPGQMAEEGSEDEGSEKESISMPQSGAGSELRRFVLVDAVTDQDLGQLVDGQIVTLSTLTAAALSIRADTLPAEVGSVVFALDGKPSYRVESAPPYMLEGDDAGDCAPWIFVEGSHTLTATPHDGPNGTGTAGTPGTITFRIVPGDEGPASATITGTRAVWHPLTVSFAGPAAEETDSSPNPFRDYRLVVTFRGPSGQEYRVPGTFDGDGRGGGAGNVWRVRFTPDAAGEWSYAAAFRAGYRAAVDEAVAGTPLSFDGATGNFTVGPRNPNAPGFLRWGRLEYVGGFHLKFRDGPYWIKTGTDSPEDLLGYRDFDATPSRHTYEAHRKHWQTGDPTWGAGRGKGLIGALNYLGAQGVNSVYALLMNVGGDFQDVWPFVGPVNPAGRTTNDNLHYDLSKLGQWEIVFAHAQRQGVALHLVLGEGEAANKRELDDGELGDERKLFYREMIARFGHHLAVTWNISEEFDLPGQPWSAAQVKSFAGHIKALDPYDHPIAAHNAKLDVVNQLLGDPRISLSSIQAGALDPIGAEVERWRRLSAQAGRPLPIFMDEFTVDMGQTPLWEAVYAPDELRVQKTWPVLLSGGSLEVILEGEVAGGDFARFAQLWRELRHARGLLEDHVPFWSMKPEDALVSQPGAARDPEVLAAKASAYVVYLPSAARAATLDLTGAAGSYTARWYNPRTGLFRGPERVLAGGAPRPLGSPPEETAQDWALLVERD